MASAFLKVVKMTPYQGNLSEILLLLKEKNE